MPKIVDKTLMQNRIIDAAFRCFSDRGFHASKMSDIALEAGLAKGTVYLYFESKDILTTTLVERAFSGYEAEILALDERPASLDGFLSGLRASLWRSPAADRATLLFFEVLGPSLALTGVRLIVGGFFDRMGQRLGRQIAFLQKDGAISDRIDPYTTGRAMSAMLDGVLTHHALFEPTEAAYGAQCDAVISLFASGLKGQPS